MHTDKIKLRRFGMHLYFGGDSQRYAEISPGYLRKDKRFLVIKGGKLARRPAIPLALCFGVG